MAKSIVRRILAVFDRASAKKTEAELASSMATAGKKSGENFLREVRAAFERRMADLKNKLAAGLIDPKTFRAQADKAAKEFNSGILAGMEKARAAGKLTDTEYLKLSRTLKRTGDEGATAGSKIGAAFRKAAAGIVAFFAIGKIKTFLADSIHEAIAAEDVLGRLDVALKTVGRSYQGVRSETERYITQLIRTTRFTDDDARLALANLITVTGSYEKALSLLNVTAQIAEKRNTTMADAAQTAGDAANGLTKGMKDLGIATKDTGDIVGKIQTNLGRLAEEGLEKPGRKLQQINKLWAEFKENIGFAILGSNTLQDSLGPDGLTGTLEALNDWTEKNTQSISTLIDLWLKAVALIGKGVKVIAEAIPRAFPGWAALVRSIAGPRNPFADVESGSSTTVKGKTLPRGGKLGDGDKDAKALAAEVERVNREIAIRLLQLEHGLTEEQAKEWSRREEVVRGGVRKIVKTVEEGWATLAQLDARLALGLDTFTPSVEKAELAVAKLRDTTASLVAQIAKIKEKSKEPVGPVSASRQELAAQFDAEQAEIAANAADHAKLWETPWTHAMDHLRVEVEGQGTLFRDLGQAWAEGGLAGLAKLAAQKVKENIASAIEMVAKGIGLSFWNPPAAEAAFASAAEHGVAALAWKALAGGGGGGSGSSTAGMGSGAPNLSRSETMEKQGAEVHIYFKGPKAFSPEMEEFVRGNTQGARERFGANAKIHIHRGP